MFDRQYLPMRRKAILCLLFAAATLAVYWPAQRCGFIEFDDQQYVFRNEHVVRGLSWESLKWALTSPLDGNWHPITALSHILDCQLFGVNPGPQHLVNVVFHTANACLLFLVLLEMLSLAQSRGFPREQLESANHWINPPPPSDAPAWRCFFVAAIFALHPLHVESVAWISERKDVLSMFFLMLTLWAYVRCEAERRQPPSGPPGKPRRFYALALFFFSLGLMSKPMLVTTPVLLLLLDYWPLGRFTNASQNKAARTSDLSPPKTAKWETVRRRAPFRLVYEKLPYFALAALFSVITFLVQRSAGAVVSLTNFALADRLDNAVVSYLRYLAKFFCPTRLAIIYPHPASHYFPVERWPEWQTPLIAMLLFAISALALLWVRRRPYFAFGWFWYLLSLLPVIGLIQVGEQAMADRYTYIPLIGPIIALVWGATDAAAKATRRMGTISPIAIAGTGFPRIVLGLLGAASLVACSILTCHQLAFWRSTRSLFEHAVAVTGGNPSCQFSMGVGLEEEGFTNLAIVRYRVAMAIEPRDPQSHYNLARLLRQQGFLATAIKQYERALELNPADVLIELNLAQTLSQSGQTRQAARHFEAALRLDPNSVEAMNNLAWLLATSPDASCRDGARAVQLAQHSCELTQFKQAVLIGTLAAAYAEEAHFDDAVATAQRACALAVSSGETKLEYKNRQLLELYRKGRPYRESAGATADPVLLP